MTRPPGSDRRLLVVLRHAKAAPHAPASSGETGDRGRPLTDRGHADAADVGRWLTREGLRPDLALVSPAVRTRETLADVLAQLPEEPTVQEVEGLYGADPQDVVEHLLGVPADTGTVLVVGHNPTMEDLIWRLQADPASPWPDNLPTSGLGVLEVPVAWADLALGAADGGVALVDGHIGRSQAPSA